MVVLGIDPGIHRTGFGVLQFEGKEPKLLDFGCIVTEPKANFSLRLTTLAADFSSLLIKWRPSVAILEEIFFSKNVKTAMRVSHARGVILELLEDFGIPVQEVKPQSVKLALTGYGKADKPQMKKMITLLLGLEKIPSSDDAVDALACALAYAKDWGQPTSIILHGTTT